MLLYMFCRQCTNFILNRFY